MKLPIGESIDRLLTIEIRSGVSSLPRGVVYPLYSAARRVAGQPLVAAAAHKIFSRVKRGDNVLIVTGAGVAPDLPAGETDGPPGAAILGRALERGLGANVLLITEARLMPPVVAAAESVGLRAQEHILPEGIGPSRAFAKAIVQNASPSLVVFVERDGPNAKGIFHGVRGNARVPGTIGHAEFILDEASNSDALTVGIGDGGNEIGFGMIYRDVRDIQPAGQHCGCPCNDGIATVATTDVLISASVSNWGAYGIAAAFASFLEKPELIHDHDTEQRLIQACVDAGARDGATSQSTASVDGISLATHQSIVTILAELALSGAA